MGNGRDPRRVERRHREKFDPSDIKSIENAQGNLGPEASEYLGHSLLEPSLGMV